MYTDTRIPKQSYEIIHQNGFDIVVNNTIEPDFSFQARTISLLFVQKPDFLSTWYRYNGGEFSSEIYFDQVDNPNFVFKKRWIT